MKPKVNNYGERNSNFSLFLLNELNLLYLLFRDYNWYVISVILVFRKFETKFAFSSF